MGLSESLTDPLGLQIGEKKTASKVDKFDSFYVVSTLPTFFLPPGSQQDVLRLQIRVHDVVTVDQKQSLYHFYHQYF